MPQTERMPRPASDLEITIALRRVAVGVVLLLVGVLLGVAISLNVDPLDVDNWWNGAVATLPPALQPLALLLDRLGGGVIATYAVPLGAAALLLLARRPWGALTFLVASAVSVGVVQLLKGAFGRVRPEDMLVISDHGSFPSGHTANAATIAVVVTVLFPRVWVALTGAAWTAAMAFSRTYVHAHWFSDTLGGALIGAGAALLVAAAFTVPLWREQERRRLSWAGPPAH